VGINVSYKIYKYWIYYIKDEYLDDIPMNIPTYYANDNHSNIYAYTDEKELARSFEEMHDMTKFIKKKVSMDVRDIRVLTEVYRNGRIKRLELTTRGLNNEKIEIPTVVTMDEEHMIDMKAISIIENLNYKELKFDFNSLNYDLQKSLKKIGMLNILMMRSGYSYFTISYNSYSFTDNESGKHTKEIYIDELEVYLDLFGSLLNTK